MEATYVDDDSQKKRVLKTARALIGRDGTAFTVSALCEECSLSRTQFRRLYPTKAKLLDALRELYEGGAPMSSQIARKVVNAFQIRAAAADPVGSNSQGKSISILSNRENEILELLAKGMLYKEIAARLFISQETVRKHVYHIYEKLHVNNRVEAINKFYRR